MLAGPMLRHARLLKSSAVTARAGAALPFAAFSAPRTAPANTAVAAANTTHRLTARRIARSMETPCGMVTRVDGAPFYQKPAPGVTLLVVAGRRPVRVLTAAGDG